MAGKRKKIIPPFPELPDSVFLVDTHCHLDMDAYEDDLDQVIERAVKVGVATVLTIGIDVESSARAVELAAAHRPVFASVGIHPHNVSGLSERHYDIIKSLAAKPEVVAYGEIGMDLVKQYAPVDQQKRHFIRQVSLAQELALPLIVHDREAHADILAVLRNAAPFPAGGVMHCFSGDMKLAEEVLDLGFHISVPGVVTFNKAPALHEVVREVSLDALLLETDGPFLAPVPMRGKRNEPAFVLYTAQKVAELKGISLGEVARRTTENAKRLFALP